MVGTLPALSELSERHRAFVKDVVQGTNPSVAAERLGYTEPHVNAYRLLRHPGIITAIRHETTRLLVVEDAPLALRVLRMIMLDDTQPANARVSAAKTVMDRAGYITPAKAKDNDDKPLAELSTAELAALVNTLESELGARATDITPTQAFDWTE